MKALGLELAAKGIHRRRDPPLVHDRAIRSSESADELRHSAPPGTLGVDNQNESVFSILGGAGADVDLLFWGNENVGA